MEVPQYRVRGEDAVLKCHYDLENDSLYAVKWYKENEEFYRFVQRAHPQITSYRVEGIKIDVSPALEVRHYSLIRPQELKSGGLLQKHKYY